MPKDTVTETKATHTPGPWRKGDHPFDIVAGEYTVVATVASDRQGLNRGREVSEANARLIAAAPELLQALRGLIGLHDDPTPYDSATTISVARVAIAKAEGR